MAAVIVSACSGGQNTSPPIANALSTKVSLSTLPAMLRPAAQNVAATDNPLYPAYTKPFTLIFVSSTYNGKVTKFLSPASLNPVALYPGPGGVQVPLNCTVCVTNDGNPIYWSVYQQGVHVSAQVVYSYTDFPFPNAAQITVNSGFCPPFNTSDSIQFTAYNPYDSNGGEQTVAATLPVTILTEAQCQVPTPAPISTANSNKIFAAAQAAYAKPQADRGLNGAPYGDECVASLNQVLKNEGFPAVGPVLSDGLVSNAVVDFEAALRKSGSSYTQTASPVPGDIVVLQDNSPLPGTHVGIYMGNGMMVSNSSTPGTFTWYATVSSEGINAAYYDSDSHHPNGTWTNQTPHYYHHN
jgi:hypothetical protein